MSWWTGATQGTRVGKYIYDATLGAWKKFNTAPNPDSSPPASNAMLSWNSTNEKVQGVGIAITSGVDAPAGSNRVNLHGEVHAVKLVAPTIEGSLAGDITGNAATATKLAGAHTIAISGAITGSASFDGSSNVTITTSVNHTHTSANITDATNANTASTVVKRDAGGNFSAGTITANITGNVSGSSGSCTGNASSASAAVTANKVRNVNFHADMVDPTGTTRLNMDGELHASKVYNAVWNDIVDFIDTKEILEKIEYGKVYCRNQTGHHELSNTYLASGILGIASDTYGFGVGHKSIDTTQLPIAIGGIVLAYVDKEYETGTPLTATADGHLTEIRKGDRAEHPERIIATYYRPEDDAEWNGIVVNERHWVRIR